MVFAKLITSVPAEYAMFPLFKEILSKISMDESGSLHASSFSSEMDQVAAILQIVTPRSLVLIDELGRSTSLEDGLAIAFAVCQALVATKVRISFILSLTS